MKKITFLKKSSPKKAGAKKMMKAYMEEKNEKKTGRNKC